MGCDRAITEDSARRIYDQLLAIHGADGCTVDEVATEKTLMTVLWTTQGKALPVAEIVHKDCAPADAIVGSTLALRVPEPLRTACPSTVQAAVTMVQRESFDFPTVSASTGDAWRSLAMVAALVAVAVALFTVAMVFRHRPVAVPPVAVPPDGP
jgi:hypothetical protein